MKRNFDNRTKPVSEMSGILFSTVFCLTLLALAKCLSNKRAKCVNPNQNLKIKTNYLLKNNF